MKTCETCKYVHLLSNGEKHCLAPLPEWSDEDPIGRFNLVVGGIYCDCWTPIENEEIKLLKNELDEIKRTLALRRIVL